MKSVCVFLAPGFEEIEALTAVDYLRRAGQLVTTVSVPAAESDEKTSVVTGAHEIPVIADSVLEDFVSELGGTLPDAVYCPGGMPGASNLAASAEVLSLIKKCSENGKLVCAMCAAPAVVISKTGVLSGKKWTCYPGMNENLAEYCGDKKSADGLTAGSEHIENVPFVFDSNLLTGRGPGTAEEFAMKLVELLTDSSTARKIHDGSCQR